MSELMKTVISLLTSILRLLNCVSARSNSPKNDYQTLISSPERSKITSTPTDNASHLLNITSDIQKHNIGSRIKPETGICIGKSKKGVKSGRKAERKRQKTAKTKTERNFDTFWSNFEILMKSMQKHGVLSRRKAPQGRMCRNLARNSKEKAILTENSLRFQKSGNSHFFTNKDEKVNLNSNENERDPIYMKGDHPPDVLYRGDPGPKSPSQKVDGNNGRKSPSCEGGRFKKACQKGVKRSPTGPSDPLSTHEAQTYQKQQTPEVLRVYRRKYKTVKSSIKRIMGERSTNQIEFREGLKAFRYERKGSENVRSNPTLLTEKTPSVLSNSTDFEIEKSEVQRYAQGPEMSFLHDSDKQAKPMPSGSSGLVPPRSNPTLLIKQTPSVLSDSTSFETKKSDVQNQAKGPKMSFLHDSDKQAKPMPSGLSGLVPPRSNPTLLRKQTPSVLSDPTSFETKKSDVQNHAQGPEMSFLHDSDKQAKPMPSGSSGLVPPRSNPTLLIKQTPSVLSDSTSFETKKI